MSARVRLSNCMARRLHAEAGRYISSHHERPVNYEDVFYLARQALDEVQGEMENPAIRPFVNHLKRKTLELLETTTENTNIESESLHEHSSNKFQSLLEETCNYISDIVCSMLCCNAQATDHLNIFVEAFRSSDIAGIATLSHDTHLEAYLNSQGIVLADGFSDEQAGVRYWSGDFSSEGRIPFLKLHGSINWYRLRPDDADEAAPWYSERIGIPLNGDPWHTRTCGGARQWPPDGRPLLLVGTFNKVTQYSEGIFRELHHRFRMLLGESDQLCVSGYSFGDKGINSEIIEWYYGKRGRRLLIIHPNCEELVLNARSAIRNKWDEWNGTASISILRKKLEEVCKDEFLQFL